VRGSNAVVSWEMMLMLDRHDPVWSEACPDLLESERPRFLAALLGRFAINLMHGFGAWQGIMITGTRAGRMLEGGNRVYTWRGGYKTVTVAAKKGAKKGSKLYLSCKADIVTNQSYVIRSVHILGDQPGVNGSSYCAELLAPPEKAS